MDTMNVMLAHIQGRITLLQRQPHSTDREARLTELELMLECLRGAINLQQLTSDKPQPPEMFTTTL